MQYRIRHEYRRYKDWNSWVWSSYAQYRQDENDIWHDYANQQPYMNWKQAFSVIEKHTELDLATIMRNFH